MPDTVERARSVALGGVASTDQPTVGTAIEAMPAAIPITEALQRQERMLTAGTVEHIVPTWLVPAPAIRMRPPQFSFGGFEPNARRTFPAPESTLIGGPRDAAYQLAVVALQPLAAPTQAVFDVSAFVPTVPVVPPIQDWVRPSVPAQPASRAYRTFTELADWLGMTQAETAELLGMGRTTPLAWRRGHEPRPARARRLYQAHALVSTLLRRLGREDASRWLVRGDPSPLDLIAAGDVAAADDLAEEVIFGNAPGQERLGAWIDESGTPDQQDAVGEAGTPRRVTRRAPRRRTR